LQVTAAGMPYFGSASHLFRPRRGKTRQAGTSLISQTATAAGRRFESQPIGPLNATT